MALIGVAYENGGLELHWHFGSDAVLDGVSGNDVEIEPGGRMLEFLTRHGQTSRPSLTASDLPV